MLTIHDIHVTQDYMHNTCSPKDKHYNAILKVKDEQISDLKSTVF